VRNDRLRGRRTGPRPLLRDAVAIVVARTLQRRAGTSVQAGPEVSASSIKETTEGGQIRAVEMVIAVPPAEASLQMYLRVTDSLDAPVPL